METDDRQPERMRDASLLLAILDRLPTSIFVKDEKLRFIYSNEAHCNIIGQPESTLLGHSDADFYPACEARDFLARDREVIENGATLESEETATGSAGVSIPVLTRKTRLVTADGKRFLIGTNTDLTEIRKREEQYRTLAQTVPVGVWQVDETGQNQFANPHFMAYLGVDTGLLQDIDIRTLLGGSRSDFPGRASRFETDLVSAMNGSRRVLVISSGWLSLTSDGIRSAIVSVVDISEMTELKRINDEISRLNSELAENMRRLSEAQDEIVARGRMAQLGHLIATVAHEIRNPLGAVRTASFLLERKLKDKNLGVEQQLQRIANGITRCDNIISQLLDFSRTKALQTAAIRIDGWLSQAVAEEAEKLPAAVTIECDFGLGDAMALIDADRLRRVIVNLMANASEAMVGKGDDPSAFACSDPRIAIASSLTPRGIEIAFADNGPGMTPEIAARILEPLFTTKNFGTGLGLPATEKILRDHHGGLEIRSAPGEGATFTAWFPMRQAANEAA